MKAIKILILFFTLTSCSFFQNKEKINSEGMPYNDDFLPNEVEVEVEKILYVIDRNGGFLRDISNEYSPIIDTLSFGMPLEYLQNLRISIKLRIFKNIYSKNK